MLKRFWLLFAQTVTVFLAIWFVVITLKPQWLPAQTWLSTNRSVTLKEIIPGALSPVLKSGAASYATAASRAMPAVVSILTRKKVKTMPVDPRFKDPLFQFFFGNSAVKQKTSTSLGSGVIVSPQGYILTNNHVIAGADDIEVALDDKRKARAQVIGVDPDTDLAVLKIDLDNLPVITLGQMQQVLVGDVVLAIGNPFGVGQTVTMGIVSALGRNHLGLNVFENFIQTDAAINPGNSGGALVDVNGNLIGINTAIFTRSNGFMGIGFAIPVSTAKVVMESIIQTGSVSRGWLGAELQEVTPEAAKAFGLKSLHGIIIAGIVQGGPAERSGIRPGDVIQRVNDKEISDTTELLNKIAYFKPGTQITIQIVRKDQTLNKTVILGKRPTKTPNDNNAETPGDSDTGN